MRCISFQFIFVRSTVFAAFALFAALGIFGQKSRCAADDHECLVNEYTAAIKVNPNNVDNYYLRAAIYAELKKFDEALRDYDKAIVLNPNVTNGYAGRGNILARQNRCVEALIELHKAFKINPQDKYVLGVQKYCLYFIGINDSAIANFDRLIEIDPGNAAYFSARGKRYLRIKNYARAVEDASKAIELDPKYADAYAVRADSYCFLRKAKESNADIARYEALTGEKTKAFCDVCEGKFIDCEIADLTAQIVAAMKMDKPEKLKSLYDRRGNLYYGKGDFDSALSDFRKTEDQDGNIPAALRRGDIYFQRGKYDEALFDFKHYLKSFPNSVKINLQVGKIYFLRRDYEAAFKYFDTAIFLNAGNAEALLGRAAIYLEQAEQYDATGADDLKAVETLKKAVNDFDAVIKNDSKQEYKAVYLKRADVYERLGEAEKAAADRAKYGEIGQKPE